MNDAGFIHIRDIIPGVMKEIARRVELRLRLEAEGEKELSDAEFLNIAEHGGIERGET